MAVFAKDGIEIRNLLRARPTLVGPAEHVYEVELTGEREAERKNRELCNQEKRRGLENHVIKSREKGVLCNTGGTKHTQEFVVTFFSVWEPKVEDKFNRKDLALYYTM